MSKIGGKIMNCKKCGQEVDKKAVVCTGCGCKIKKPLYKKWWLWAIVVVVIAIIGSSSGGEEPVADTTPQQSEEIVYEIVDLQTMFNTLDENAMKAEKTYQKKYIEFECQIKSFDSDGSYISVEPVGASEWNFSSAMCYIKDDVQENYLIEKNVGDVIKIKGKVKSIGEVMGYSIDINEVY